MSTHKQEKYKNYIINSLMKDTLISERHTIHSDYRMIKIKTPFKESYLFFKYVTFRRNWPERNEVISIFPPSRFKKIVIQQYSLLECEVIELWNRYIDAIDSQIDISKCYDTFPLSS